MKKSALCFFFAACSTAPSSAPTTNNKDAAAQASPKTTVAKRANGTTASFQPHKKELASALTGDAAPLCSRQAGHRRCRALARLDDSGQVFLGSEPAGLGLSDLQATYDLDPLASSPNAIVALVDAFDAPDAESDLATYRQQFGLPACTHANGCFKKVNQDGQDLHDQASSQPAADPDWTGETTLDIEMASAGCPTCKILLVETYDDSNANLYAGVDAAAKLGATVISNSWGDGEYVSETDDDVHFNHPGIGVFVASGDNGYGVGYPDTSPYIFSVGGTNVGFGNDGLQQVAWDGTASGCSAYEPKPAWQTDSLCPNRTETDLSAVADPSTGPAVYVTFPFPNSDGSVDVEGGWFVFGGTSVASPLVAAIFASTGHGADQPSVAWNNPSAFTDVTAGSNGDCGKLYLCNAGTGYDGPTGNGTPKGKVLATVPAQ